MGLAKILWVDDEIESLQSQKLFLEAKGYEVHTLTNGFDAIDYVRDNAVDVVLLDETMPGITGLETLAKIKEMNQQLAIVLITKNETENLMDEAIIPRSVIIIKTGQSQPGIAEFEKDY
jgi:CheY-like chemotaxis protein